MAKKIKYADWDEDQGYIDTFSREEYDQYQVQATRDAEMWGYTVKEASSMTLYSHEGTGIVVTNVKKFEDWLATVVTR